LDKEQGRIRQGVEDRVKQCRLTEDEKKELLSTIRFSFMKHEELLEIATKPIFSLAKDFIVEGLSCRLNSFENGIK
jgi:hypothetical protein